MKNGHFLKFTFFLFLASLIPVYGEDPCCEPQYHVTDHYCDNEIPLSRSDQIPQTHVAWATDEYLTGYIQALLDSSYYDYDVKVFVRQGIVYVFNLPCNALLSQSIICFIYDVPCIRGVEPLCCSWDEYFSAWPSEEIPDYCNYPTPTCQIGGIWFPQNTILFAPLIADPRQVTNSAALRFNDHPIGKRVGAVAFGDDFSIYRWLDFFCTGGDLEFLIEAGIFAVFDLKNPEACMVNTDFFVAGTLAYAINQWSFRFRWWHLSSHLGDEFLLAHPGYDRRNVSDEGVDLFASYQLGRAIRLYAGLGDIYSRDKTFPQKPFYAEWGTEIRVFGCRSCYDKLYIQPFLAMHFASWQEHNYSIDQTYLLGVEYSKLQGIGRKFRVFFEFHNGFSLEGQFVRERSSYYAIRVMFGF